MMDVSGSMTDEQKEIVRIEAFWIDTWIKAHYQGVETVYIIHDAVAQEVDEHTFYHTREIGRHEDQLGLRAVRQDHRRRATRRTEWNVYAFHFSDGDNWGDDIPNCIEILTEKLLPKLNLFGYGQVESPYGSRRVLRVRPRAARRARERRRQPHPGPRGDPGVDQGVPGHRDDDSRLAACAAVSRRVRLSRRKVTRPCGMPYNTNLPPDLRALKDEIEGYARELRARLLRDHLRGGRRRRPERDRGLRRLPDALPALVVRHAVRGAEEGLRVRAVEDLRDGDQQRPVLRLPDALQPHGRSEAGDGPRLRPLRLLQEQRLLRAHQPQDDGRDGQPRRPHPPLRREVRRGRGRGVRRPLHVDRRPDRHPLGRHPPPRRRRRATTSRRDGRGRGRRPADAVQEQGLHGRLHQPAARRSRPRRRSAASRPRAADPQLPRAAGEGRAAVPDRARPAQDLAARRALDRPRRGVLLRPAGADEDHERRLGQLLAQHHHDAEGARSRRR